MGNISRKIVSMTRKTVKQICTVTWILIACVVTFYTCQLFQSEVQERVKDNEAKWSLNRDRGQHQSLTQKKYASTADQPYIQLQDLSKPFRTGGSGPYQNLLDAEPPFYLANFKNPCWREELLTKHPYPQNGYFLQKWAFLRSFSDYIRAGKPWRLRCLPYFYLAGFVKSGTTELFNNIRNHPMVGKNHKEIHWWTRYRNCIEDNGTKRNLAIYNSVSKGAVPIRDYIDIFDTAAKSINDVQTVDSKRQMEYHPMIIGEGSTLTVSKQECWWLHPENEGRKPGRDFPNYINAHYIHHVTPGAKFIISMRDPANRLYSQFRMHRGLGPEEFHTRVENALQNMTTCIKHHGLFACTDMPYNTHKSKFALSESLYYAHLVRWLQVFPKEQFHFVKLEEFSNDRVAGLNQIFEFLDLEPLAEEVLEKESYHIKIGCENCTFPLMFNETRNLLNDFFAPYNAQLADLLHDKRWLFL